MFKDDQFLEPMDVSTWESITYLKVRWNIGQVQFPIVFYVTQFDLSSGSSRFNIINNGCLLDLVDANLHSDWPYQTTSADFSYRTFMFGTNQKLTLDFGINFCIKTDLLTNSCGMKDQCPVGYHPQLQK